MSDDIEVKQLRNEVQLLRDELAIMKRKFEDILYNLDDDNFSSRIVREKGNMKTAIEVNAEGIKTKVSNDEFQSAMTQTAEKIETEVSNLDKTLSSKITQTANEIELSVSALDSEISSLSVTTSGIRSKVNNIEDGEFNGYTLFEQTGSKFSFTGNVEISGDAIVSGTISADRIDTENLSCTRLYAKDDFDGYSARLNGTWGDFGIFSPQASDDALASDFNCMFGIYNSVPNVNFLVYGNNFLGYDVRTDTVWAKGNWNFGVANVEGLENSGYANEA